VVSLKVGVLYGGISPEREVSLNSGKFVYEVLTQEGMDAVLIDVGRDIGRRLEEERVDVVYVALHGGWGESGAIQGLLEIKGIPYTGSDLTSSALALHKELSKRMFSAEGIPIPNHVCLPTERIGHLDTMLIWENLNRGNGVIVKPEDQGSTIGVTVVREYEGLNAALEVAGKYSKLVIVEEFIPSVEITAAVVGGDVLPIIEIAPKRGIYDYTAKYTKGMTEYIIPARIGNSTMERAKVYAMQAYNVLGCRGIARVDMLVSRNKGDVYVLEVNTSPGMTETSLVPKAIKAAGLEIGKVLKREVEEALNMGVGSVEY